MNKARPIQRRSIGTCPPTLDYEAAVSPRLAAVFVFSLIHHVRKEIFRRPLGRRLSSFLLLLAFVFVVIGKSYRTAAVRTILYHG